MAASTRSRTNATRPPLPPLDEPQQPSNPGQFSRHSNSVDPERDGGKKPVDIETEDTANSPHPNRELHLARQGIQVEGFPHPSREFQMEHPDLRLLHNTIGSLIRRIDGMEYRHERQKDENTRIIREELERQNMLWRQEEREKRPHETRERQLRSEGQNGESSNRIAGSDFVRINQDENRRGEHVVIGEQKDREKEASHRIHHETVKSTDTVAKSRVAKEHIDKEQHVASPPPKKTLGEADEDKILGQFTDKVMAAIYPKGLNSRELPKYDGTQDPLIHLNNFKMEIMVKGINGDVVPRLFAGTFRGAAQLWFHSLPYLSIPNMKTLEQKFLTHFATSRRHPKTEFQLAQVRQGSGEALSKYLDRFNSVALQIPGLKEEVNLHCIIAGLDVSSRLKKSIMKRRPTSLADFHDRSQQYLDLEQMEKAGNAGKERAKSPTRRERENRERNHQDSYRKTPRSLETGGKTREPRFDRYTPLKISQAKLWKEVGATEMKKVERPRALGKRATADKTRFCEFHDQHGHTTEQCWDLKNTVEKFIREGKLQRYVIQTQGKQGGKRHVEDRSRSPQLDKRKKEQKKKSDDSDEEFPDAKYDCNVISGGFGGGGDSSSQRRKYLKEVLSIKDAPTFKKDMNKPESPVLCFTDEDLKDVAPGHHDGLVITGTLVNCRVKKIFVDNGSAVDIILWDAFKRMNFDSDVLKPCRTMLTGFNGQDTRPKGYVDLKLTLGDRNAFKTERVRFIVADFPSSYNVILGRPTIHNWDMLVSSKHQKLKMISRKNKIVTVKGDQKESRQCYFNTVKKDSTRPTHPVADTRGKSVNLVELDLRKEEKLQKTEPTGELEDFLLGTEPGQITKIGKALDPGMREELETLLRNNRDVFAWQPSEIPGIDPDFCCHELAIRPGSTPVSQKKRKLGEDRRNALEAHVAELLEAGFIREIQYTTWLSNVVLVKKPNGKWRVCTDFKDLNKVCPKDSFPMPNIDQLVDSSSGFRLLSFMDAYSGYNQIAMHPEDQAKTAFITEKANYCYNVMPFGLKNAGATYQRMMNRVFEDQIGRNVEVYIDDMIVKSLNEANHIDDLRQTFDKLRRYRIRLNPAKCAFGVPSGKFLGFLLTNRGIEVNPDKCQAVLDMQPPRNKKEVQQLTGRLAALTRFLPKSAESSLPFFKLLKKEASGGWTAECEAAFGKIKQCLSAPPVLTRPRVGESLILYLSVGNEAVSAALVRETTEGQSPIYFVGRALQGSELRYQKVEKMAFALLIAARRLRPYFQSHPVIVRTNQPIRQILHKPDLAGRMVGWAIELSEFDITYEARHAIKSQALADFIMELTPVKGGEDQDTWKLFVDGSSNTKGSGAGVIVESPEGIALELSLRFNFSTSNNQAEYEALIAGLLQAKESGARRVHVSTDSQLVASQINGTYQAKGPLMIKYLGKVKEVITEFDEVTIAHIPRGDNVRADVLSKLASTKSPGSHRTIVQQNLREPSCVMLISDSDDWRKPIVDYIERGILPDESLEAKKLMRSAASYTLVNDQLYRKGMHSPMMKCLAANEAQYVLLEIHEGINGHHMGAKALARKAVRAGYFWPTLAADAKTHVQKCDSCQRHANTIRSPPATLQTISAPWPFFKWGMDLLGPFKRAAGQLRWLIVAVDYFTKWIEVEPVATITSSRVQKFLQRNIIARFGIPAEIVTDNGTQFIDKSFRKLVADFNIKHHFASVEHPQSNGQAEAANKIIVDGLRKRVEDATSSWVDQLPYTLWGYRTSVQTSTGETPFKLTYGCEAMIPVEIGESSWRRVTALQNEEENGNAIAVELDLIDEVRTAAHCRDLAAKQLISTRYNQKVRPRAFDKGSLVLRRADIGNKNAAEGKLAPNWEGPYRVTENLGKGAYKLETLQGKAIKRTWNADKLKVYYS